MLTISYTNREEETAANYEDAVEALKDRFRHATFNKEWENFGPDYERQLVWANPFDAACDILGFRAVAQIVRPSTTATPTKSTKSTSAKSPSSNGSKATNKKPRRSDA